MNEQQAKKLQKALVKIADVFSYVLYVGLGLMAIFCIGGVIHGLWVTGSGGAVIAVGVVLVLVGTWLFLYHKTKKVLGKDEWE